MNKKITIQHLALICLLVAAVFGSGLAAAILLFLIVDHLNWFEKKDNTPVV